MGLNDKIGELTAKNEELTAALSVAEAATAELQQQFEQLAQNAVGPSAVANQAISVDIPLEKANERIAQMVYAAKQANHYKACSWFTTGATAAFLLKVGYDHYFGSESTTTKFSGGVSASSVPQEQGKMEPSGEAEADDEFAPY